MMRSSYEKSLSTPLNKELLKILLMVSSPCIQSEFTLSTLPHEKKCDELRIMPNDEHQILNRYGVEPATNLYIHQIESHEKERGWQYSSSPRDSKAESGKGRRERYHSESRDK